VQCARQGSACGEKRLPSDDQAERLDEAREKENQQAMQNFIQARQARGQDWETILAIMDPDGSIAPYPANGQPQQNPIDTSYPQHLQPGTNPMQFITHIPTQNTFEQPFAGADASSFPSMASTASSSAPMMMNPFNNPIHNDNSIPPSQPTQLWPSSIPRSSFEPVAPYTTEAYPTMNNFDGYGTLSNGQRIWSENRGINPASDTTNNWQFPVDPLVPTNHDMNETYDYNYFDRYSTLFDGNKQNPSQY
jgi:hypothetical protein